MDREKVIKDIEKQMNEPTNEYVVLWFSEAEYVLAVLKEQDAQKVTWRVGRAHCPSCGELFPKKQDKQYIRFCNYCGQAVEWE